ncbi:MOSC domain-containing protein [Radiobacillus sp. PE A8.2]|uniref:MOSC domain-containing protein n=1 Tax=Radiobacillus sp. PE A8.2 TaxID=3380349 RepID=UPI00388ECDEC
MGYEIKSLNIGEPKIYQHNGKELHTAFVKHPVNETLWLSKIGLAGDGQADMKNHGGEDKALLLYPYEHYAYWQHRYEKTFTIPAFGENVTIEGITEDNLYIGDVYRLGEALIQVSQPRNPCYKIAAINELKDITAVVTETGYNGVYFRVLQEGNVNPDDKLTLVKTNTSQISAAYISKILHHDKQNRKGIETILQVNEIAVSLRNSLEKRLAKLKDLT